MGDKDDRRVGWSSRQLDAHVLVMTLRQLLTAEQLEQAALTQLAADPAVGAALTAARQRFEDALPGVKHMRDALMHFDEWSQGKGRGPQKQRHDTGQTLRDIARDFSRFGYDPAARTVEFGPYEIEIETASRAAVELTRAIVQAAREVDVASTARLRQRTVRVLADARIPHSSAGDLVCVSAGNDLRVCLSFRLDSGADEKHLWTSADQVVSVLALAKLHLESNKLAEHLGMAERLVRGEILIVAEGTGS
jgi:hypothetical protein